MIYPSKVIYEETKKCSPTSFVYNTYNEARLCSLDFPGVRCYCLKDKSIYYLKGVRYNV